MGSIYQTHDIVQINNIEELIFCSKDVSSKLVIKTMLGLSDFDIEYKIAPPESVSIIGSNSIDTAGDLYVVNVNAITKERNRRNKKLFDDLLCIFLLISSPISIWFVKRKQGYFANIFKVLFQKFSWVGYHEIHSELFLGLPVIHKGILKTTDLPGLKELGTDSIDRANMQYARDYSLTKDIEIVFKAFSKLGQKR